MMIWQVNMKSYGLHNLFLFINNYTFILIIIIQQRLILKLMILPSYSQYPNKRFNLILCGTYLLFWLYFLSLSIFTQLSYLIATIQVLLAFVLLVCWWELVVAWHIGSMVLFLHIDLAFIISYAHYMLYGSHLWF